MRHAALEQTMQGLESRAHRRRVSRHVRRAPLRRGFDAPTFEDDEREIPLGGDDKPPSP
jgi:hypothetical protein